MSDALTDIARDERRGKCFEKYLDAVKNYLLNPSKENLDAVIKIAEETDDVRGGYWGGRTSLSKGVGERMERLKNNDKQEWAKFLSRIIQNDYFSEFKEFKKLSPFKDKLVLRVHYGAGWGPEIEGEIKNVVTKIIREKKNWKTYDCDYYFVVMDMPSLEDADAFWLDCGILGIDGPRKNKS